MLCPFGNDQLKKTAKILTEAKIPAEELVFYMNGFQDAKDKYQELDIEFLALKFTLSYAAKQILKLVSEDIANLIKVDADYNKYRWSYPFANVLFEKIIQAIREAKPERITPQIEYIVHSMNLLINLSDKQL